MNQLNAPVSTTQSTISTSLTESTTVAEHALITGRVVDDDVSLTNSTGSDEVNGITPKIRVSEEHLANGVDETQDSRSRKVLKSSVPRQSGPEAVGAGQVVVVGEKDMLFL